MSTPLIEVRNLSKSFGAIRAVDDLSFELHQGAVFGLIGANGAGKTTTMRMLATLEQPDSGTILLQGVDVVQFPASVRSRLGWMPDSFQAYADTSVREYLDFFARAQGLGGAPMLRRLDEVMDFTELSHLDDRLIQALSKGQSQRLCLARTLLSDPSFLLLDEPAAGLDPKARLEFKNLVRILRDRGKTLLISSHILSELGEMCDSLIFMDAGRLVHHGDTQSLQQTGTGEGILVEITVEGATTPLLEWLSVRPGWKLGEELRDGARARFARTDKGAVAEELRRMVADGLVVVEFKRVERRLEEAFVDMLRERRSVQQQNNKERRTSA